MPRNNARRTCADTGWTIIRPTIVKSRSIACVDRIAMSRMKGHMHPVTGFSRPTVKRSFEAKYYFGEAIGHDTVRLLDASQSQALH